MKYSILILFSFSLLFFQCSKADLNTVDQDNLTFIGTGSGCINFLVYKLNENKDIGLAVEGIKDALNLTTSEQTFDLSTEQHLSVKIENLSQGDNFYCDDSLEADETVLHTFNSVSGFVQIQITEDSINYSGSLSLPEIHYKLNVNLKNILLQDTEGNEVRIAEEKFTDVLVGWFPG